ncbi:hypothetical protein QR98_0020520, partial [Sarcoptes scabiei]
AQNRNLEPNIGLVQFSCPVLIHEIRIVPLATIVTAECLRSFRLGATNPSSFEINFFVNDLKAKDSSTFLDIGSFSYKDHENYIFKPSMTVATDGLLLTGRFESVTLAVLGRITNLNSLLKKETNSSKISQESQNLSKIYQQKTSDFHDNGNTRRNVEEIKEPDDDDPENDFVDNHQNIFINAPNQIESNVCNYRDYGQSVITNQLSSSKRLIQEVHSLSPSPDRTSTSIARTHSPSPRNLSFSSTSKSNSEERRSLSNREKYYDPEDINRYSSTSRSNSPDGCYLKRKENSISTSLKSRIAYPSNSSRNSDSSPYQRTRIERDRDDLNSTSHHRTTDEKSHKYNYSHRSSNRSSSRSRERSPRLPSPQSRLISPCRYQNSAYQDDYSLSHTKESEKDYHNRSNHHRYRNHHSGHQRQGSSNSSSRDHRHHHRNSLMVCSSTPDRDDNRSVSSLKARRSGGRDYYYDYNDDSCDYSSRSSNKYRRYDRKNEKDDDEDDNEHRLSRSRSHCRSRSISSDYQIDRSSPSESISRYHRSHKIPSKIDCSARNICNSSSATSSVLESYKWDNLYSPCNISSTSAEKEPSSLLSESKNFKNDRLTDSNQHEIKRDASPFSRNSFKEIESIASPLSQNDIDENDLSLMKTDSNLTLNPSQTSTLKETIAIESPHSSISNDSLDQFESDTKTHTEQEFVDVNDEKSITNDNLSVEGDTNRLKSIITDDVNNFNQTNDDKTAQKSSVDDLEARPSNADKEDLPKLFEPLSPSSDNDSLLQMENVDNINADEDIVDNYERISTTSESNDENDCVDENNFDSNRIECGDERAELELISSDEEYDNDLNAALSSDRVEYAKNYLDNNLIDQNSDGLCDEDEIDSSFDPNDYIFDPNDASIELKPLKFLLHTNRSTIDYVDLKLFKSIISFVNENFLPFYTVKVEDGDLTETISQSSRKDRIKNEWVINVERLAEDIMRLSCPIYCSFNSKFKDDDQNNYDYDTNDCDHQELGHNFDDTVESSCSQNEIDDLVRILISIAKDGLDFDLALSHEHIPFKTRHLKAGIKLLISLFNSFDIRSEANQNQFYKKLLEEDLPFCLLRLFNEPFLTLSLKLMILNGLIVICDHPDGVEYLVRKSFDWGKSSKSSDHQELCLLFANQSNLDTSKFPTNATCYQFLLNLVLDRQLTRLSSVFEELFEKIHLFELFETFSQLDLSSITDDKCNQKHFEQNLSAILEKIIDSFHRFSNRTHRPLRFMPNISQFEMRTAVHASVPLVLISSVKNLPEKVPNYTQYEYIHSRFNCRHTECSSSKIGYKSQNAFYSFFRHFNLFDTLIVALETIFSEYSSKLSQSSGKIEILSQTLRLFNLFTNHQQGLKFLLEDEINIQFTKKIHSILTGFTGLNLCADYDALKIHFITKLYTFSLIDQILDMVYSYQSLNLPKTFDKSSSAQCLSVMMDPSKNSAIIKCLLRLFMMIHFRNATFRNIVVSVLTLEHNFDAIHSFLLPITINLVTNPNKDLINEKILNLDKISFIYAAKIAIACVQYLPERNLLHFYDIYGKILLKNIENVRKFMMSSSMKLHRSDVFQNHISKYANLINWISPLNNIDLLSMPDELSIRKFVSILKKHHDLFLEKFNQIENFTDRVFFFEPELITAIKILVVLCDPEVDSDKNQDPDLQLRYKYSLISCYCFDSLTYLLVLLDALTETCRRPSQLLFMNQCNDSFLNILSKHYSDFVGLNDSNRSAANVNNGNVGGNDSNLKPHLLQQFNASILNQGSLIFEFLRPSVKFLKLILEFILKSYGSNFSDSNPISTLLKLFHIMDKMTSINKEFQDFNQRNPLISNLPSLAESMKKEIIEIIQNVYTVVFVEHSESEELMRKSVWTKMLKQVFEFTLFSPEHYASGLSVLTEILPKPLPWSIRNRIMTEKETIFITNYRKLWSAHFQCSVANNSIENVIDRLLLCDCFRVQTLLRIFCHKICDLYSSTVLTVSKSILEFFVHSLCNLIENRSYDQQETMSKSTLGLVESDLLSSSLSTSFKNGTDPKIYCQNFLKIIDFIMDLFETSIPFRIGILNAFDCFINSDASTKNSKINLILGKIFEHLAELKFSESINLTTDDFIMKIFAESENRNEIKNESERSENSENYLLNTLLQFFDSNENVTALKTFKFSDKLMSKFVLICSPLLDQYFDSRKIFKLTDNECGIDENDRNIVEIDMEQKDRNFNQETTFGEDSMENLSLSHTTIEDNENKCFVAISNNFSTDKIWKSLAKRKIGFNTLSDPNNSKINLLDYSKKNLDINLEELSKIMSNFHLPIVEPPEHQNQSQEVSKLTELSSQPKRSSIRGRGRLYGHRGDPFRSRPPNTSRPPSMHVDDFVAMEQRSDSLAGLAVKNRSNHSVFVAGGNSTLNSNNSLLISNQSPMISYINKHNDYIRKKTVHANHFGGQPHLPSASSSSPYHHTNFSSKFASLNKSSINNTNVANNSNPKAN